MIEFDELVRGKSVAVVGNALSLVQNLTSYGKAIDAHDVVIRMNMGLPGIRLGPGRTMTEDKVGSRTDIWATAKYFGVEPTCKLGVFMKLTALGDEHWKLFQKRERTFPMIRWTPELEAEVKEFVGADPGTGIRMVYYLKKHAKPAQLRVFGMDCWDTVSTWSGKPNTPNHVPNLEKQALASLMSE